MAPSSSVPVAVIPVPSGSVLSILNPAGFPEYAGPTGIVEGTLTALGDPAPPSVARSFQKCPEAQAFYAKRFREGPARPDGARPIADAIVAVQMQGTGLFVAEHEEAAKVTIDHCVPSARTVVLTYGQRLEVKNASDPATKRTYAPQFENAPDKVLMVATPGADPVRLYPKTLGRYRMIDRAGNDWLEVDVYVIGHPLHAVTDKNGHFRIEGIPAGKRTIEGRHPAIAEPVAAQVEIRQNVVERVDLVLPSTKPAPAPGVGATGPVMLP